MIYVYDMHASYVHAYMYVIQVCHTCMTYRYVRVNGTAHVYYMHVCHSCMAYVYARVKAALPFIQTLSYIGRRYNKVILTVMIMQAMV